MKNPLSLLPGGERDNGLLHIFAIKSTICAKILAGEQGFEPQLSDPESDVLPIKLFPNGCTTKKIIPQQGGSGKF